MKKISLLILLSAAAVDSFAQRDTTRKQSIDITSSYKPELRNAIKINFSASQLNVDSSKLISAYQIPQQNLFYTYMPGALKPLALQQDTMLQLGDRNYLKAGIGNYATPYFGAGLSFGDGKKGILNVYANYISSSGTIKNQDYADFDVKAAGHLFTGNNEIYGAAAIQQQDYSLYGYDHALFNYNKGDVLQRFQNVKLNAGIRNKDLTASSLNYDPSVQINIFNNQAKATENSLLITAPVSRAFSDAFTLKLTATADITSYSTKNLTQNVSLNNNIFSVAPEVMYNLPDANLNFHAGINPTWDNTQLSVLPNFYGQYKIKGQSFTLQAGLVGRIIKNSFQNLTAINPFLEPVTAQKNTKEIEFYGGLKTSIADHFNLNAKVSYLSYTNLPFFVNDKSDQKSFVISNESSVKDLRIHGDIGYVNQDKFTATAGLTINGYTGMKDNSRAWGTIPMEFNASIRWWAFKQLLIKGDYLLFSGSPILLANNQDATLKGGNDLSAGFEYVITKNFSAWLNINNIFNDKYERWHNYQVYGLNVLGGITYKF